MSSSIFKQNPWPPGALRAALIAGIVLSLLLIPAHTSHATPPQPTFSSFRTVSLPGEAPSASIRPEPFNASSPKMEGALSQLAAAARSSTGGGPLHFAPNSFRMGGEKVQVLITTDAARAGIAAETIREAGGRVTGTANGGAWLQAWAPATALEALAASPALDYISRPAEFVPAEITQGAVAINAPAWNSAGVKGSGVRVAVIDIGFQGYTALLGSELPANVTVKNFVDAESDRLVDATTPHGAACAEIIHDIAPNAALYLAKIATVVDLEEAVSWARAQKVHIISTSLGIYNFSPGDGTGYLANLVESASKDGILWVTAAGNDREAHWGGAFNDTNSNGYHEFAGAQEVNFYGPGNGNAYLIPAGNVLQVYLRWDDWTAVKEDYDLYVLRWDGDAWQTVGRSDTRQTGSAGQTPTEWVSVTTSGEDAIYGFSVRRHAGTRNVNLEIFAPRVAPLDKAVSARSISNLADAPFALTVAALDVNSPYPQESYSSEGPANGPGGTAGGGATKPDISAFANVSTVSYPNLGFNGTSCAAPHVTAAAALIKSANPDWTPAQIQSFLAGRAVDMGAVGKDVRFGWGRLSLGAAPLVSQPVLKKIYLPVVIRPAPPPTYSWTTLLADDFEGSFPGPWQLWTPGEQGWGGRNCQAASGNYSAWAVGGGGLSCGAYYPDNNESWMYYGPFSLADAAAVELSYALWANTESGVDKLCLLASLDNVDYSGLCASGNSNGWLQRTFDLTNVYELGDLRGRPQVWIAFVFTTNDATHFQEGVHVDDVVLRKCIGACPNAAASVNAAAGETMEPVTLRRPR